MAKDDRRMHEGFRHEEHGTKHPTEPLTPNDDIGVRKGDGVSHHRAEGHALDDDTDLGLPSALGGHAATRSGTAETPEDERFD